MIVTFCGHSHFLGNEEYERRVMEYLKSKIGDKPVQMYLGGYGGFDDFSYNCCKKYKKTNPNTSIIFVAPYLHIAYKKDNYILQKARYDDIVYPEIEDKPKRYAIVYRNRYMVEKADFVVACISHDWGGAYKTYKYAKRLKKEIFNLADFE